jgi:hypothetical protein
VGERSKWILIKGRLDQGECIKLVDAKFLILEALVAERDVLTLLSVLTYAEHTLKHPQETTGG